MGLDTLQKRYDQLKGHIKHYGPSDDAPRPAVLWFHGCGGVGPNNEIYARACAEIGVRAFVVDSFAARGWTRKWGATFTCNGLRLRGHERSGDVLAALWGIRQRADVDPNRVILAGWSHGAWAIMDLMTQRLDRHGEARLENPTPEPMQGVKGVFLLYPFVSFPSRSVLRDWRYDPKTFMILALKDHLAGYRQSLSLVKTLRRQGLDVETLTVNATHAFDEEGIDRFGFMKYDAEAMASTLMAMRHFMTTALS
jgi:dienelactone hydrolase